MPERQENSSAQSSVDLLGLGKLAGTVDKALEKSLQGLGEFLKRICLPAAEEYGLLLRDRVNLWRLQNLVKIGQKAQRLVKQLPGAESRRAHPRMVWAIMDHGSWSDDGLLQSMWGGLLASSCTTDGRDESNLIYVNILAQLTAAQARLLDYGCREARLALSDTGLLMVEELSPLDTDKVMQIARLTELHILDRDLDHLRSLELIVPHGGLAAHMHVAIITPMALALGMYARCQGSLEPPGVFFRDRIASPAEDQAPQTERE